MIRVCERCKADMTLPEDCRARFCLKGSECYRKRMSEKVKRCTDKKKLLVNVIPNNFEVVPKDGNQTTPD